MFLRRVRLRVGFRLGLGIGFREWVPIRNIIGGAAGAHIPMRFGLQLSACVPKCLVTDVDVQAQAHTHIHTH